MHHIKKMAYFPAFLAIFGVGLAFLRWGLTTSIAGIICGIIAMKMSLEKEHRDKEKQESRSKNWPYVLGYCSAIICLESGIGSIVALALPWN